MTRVIVVDDDADTVEVFSEFLELKDIEVVGRAHDGKEAAEVYECMLFDLIENLNELVVLRGMAIKQRLGGMVGVNEVEQHHSGLRR